MNCGFDKTLLSFYLDNELSDDEARMVEVHLEECQDCKKEFSELQELSKVLSELEEVEVSADYDGSFNEKFNKIRKKEPSISPWERKKLWDEVKDILSNTSTVVKATVPLVFVVVLSFTLFALRPGDFPTVITAKGNVEVYDDQFSSWRQIKSGDRLNHGSIIRTAKASFLDVELDGVYKIRVKPNAEVLVNNVVRSRREGLTQFELVRGDILVKIDKHLDKSSFEVKTAFGVLEAKGTAFMVNINIIEKETLLGVSEGKVLVKTDKKKNLVGKNEKVIVTSSGLMRGPYPLEEEDKKSLGEVKEIGKIFVVLGISNTFQRAKELLEPARLYAYGKYPIEAGDILDEALVLLARASKNDSRKLHLLSIKEFEKIINLYPSPKYNPQVLLFIASYYEYLSLHNMAIDTFKQIADRYPGTNWASIAILAQGIIYKEKLEDVSNAQLMYDKILTSYPESLEAKFVKNSLKSISD